MSRVLKLGLLTGSKCSEASADIILDVCQSLNLRSVGLPLSVSVDQLAGIAEDSVVRSRVLGVLSAGAGLEQWGNEVGWADHLGLRAVLCPSPSVKDGHLEVVALGSRLSRLLDSHDKPIYVRMPFVCTQDVKMEVDGWTAWKALHRLCNYHSNLYVAVEMGITYPLPHEDAMSQAAYVALVRRYLLRWKGEPVGCVLLPTHLLETSGSPPKLVTELLRQFMDESALIMLDTNWPIESLTPNSEARVELTRHLTQVQRLFDTMTPLTTAEEYVFHFREVLQTPLRPLQDNLLDSIYATFEADTVKYDLYEAAVEQCLRDRTTSGEESHVVVVAGAGRGAIVDRVLVVVERLALTSRVVAVDKNLFVYQTLLARQRTEARWKNVEIVSTDMRHWEPHFKADVIVSELLGSLGDNEQSPECIDGAQSILKANGVIIPQSYTSSVQPISSTVLWTLAGQHSRQVAYCVYPSKYHTLDDPKDLLTFTHPSPPNPDNSRNVSVPFLPHLVSECHGFLGYFSCRLYGDVVMSTDPRNATPDMCSWFPLYLPLESPLQVTPTTPLTLHFWRRVTTSNVWYEWAIQSGEIFEPIHNAGGTHMKLGL